MQNEVILDQLSKKVDKLKNEKKMLIGSIKKLDAITQKEMEKIRDAWKREYDKIKKENDVLKSEIQNLNYLLKKKKSDLIKKEEVIHCSIDQDEENLNYENQNLEDISNVKAKRKFYQNSIDERKKTKFYEELYQESGSKSDEYKKEILRLVTQLQKVKFNQNTDLSNDNLYRTKNSVSVLEKFKCAYETEKVIMKILIEKLLGWKVDLIINEDKIVLNIISCYKMQEDSGHISISITLNDILPFINDRITKNYLQSLKLKKKVNPELNNSIGFNIINHESSVEYEGSILAPKCLITFFNKSRAKKDLHKKLKLVLKSTNCLPAFFFTILAEEYDYLMSIQGKKKNQIMQILHQNFNNT